MRWLLFLSRLAFICNVFFLLAVSLLLFRWAKNDDAEAIVIILGYFMVALLNPAANISYLVLAFTNKVKLAAIPKWLRTANIIFLLFQFMYLIYLNGRQFS